MTNQQLLDHLLGRSGDNELAELRKMGHSVKSEEIRDGSRHWAVYWMEGE